MKLSRYTDTSLSRSEFTPRLAERICAEAMDTPSITQVANRVNIPITTLRRWLKLGHDGDPRFQEFALEFAKARGQHEDRWLGNVEDVAALDDPRAANAKLRANEFLLKKHFRKEYGDHMSVSTVVDNRTANFNLKALAPHQLRHLHTMLKVVDVDNEGGREEDVKQLLAELPVIDVQQD